MDDEARRVVERLRWCFSDLADPRVLGRCDHALLDIITITILAVMSHAEDWTDVELFGHEREEWLKGFLKLSNGIPSHDTFQRVFGLLDRTQFAAGLLRWTQTLHEATGGKILSIDGKALRHSLRRKSGLPALHLVTMWASENGLTLAQAAVEDGIKTMGKENKASEGSLILIDNETGAIKALVGGRDYSKSKFNRATQARRQPGSSFKTFVYAAALEAGLSPGDIRYDAPIQIGKWRPRNYSGDYRGAVTLS